MEIKHMVKTTNDSIDIKVQKNGQNHYCTLKSMKSIGPNGKILRKNEYNFSPFLSSLSDSEKQEIFDKAKEKFNIKIIH